VSAEGLRERAWKAVSAVVDPEIPVLTIAELGVLRGVHIAGDTVEVTITPTYSGCPAMRVIEIEIGEALRRAGVRSFHLTTVLSPPWTTDWLTLEGKRKLAAFGIAPPGDGAGRRALFSHDPVACPRCRSHEVERISEFGSTACKALYRCRFCAEPFDYFKCH
jgi:ring-1,2-phenylacetyl-CoA epoxidase subunit PaaD